MKLIIVCSLSFFYAAFAQQIDLDYYEEDVQSLDAGFPPPSDKADQIDDADTTCPCTHILVSSLGDAAHLHPDSMGVYQQYQTYNGKPAYHGPNSKRLYFLPGSGWLLGSTLGGSSGFVHNPNKFIACPYLIAGDQWMYVNNGYWYKDPTLVVRCIQ